MTSRSFIIWRLFDNELLLNKSSVCTVVLENCYTVVALHENEHENIGQSGLIICWSVEMSGLIKA